MPLFGVVQLSFLRPNVPIQASKAISLRQQGEMARYAIWLALAVTCWAAESQGLASLPCLPESAFRNQNNAAGLAIWNEPRAQNLACESSATSQRFSIPAIVIVESDRRSRDSRQCGPNLIWASPLRCQSLISGRPSHVAPANS